MKYTSEGDTVTAKGLLIELPSSDNARAAVFKVAADITPFLEGVDDAGSQISAGFSGNS